MRNTTKGNETDVTRSMKLLEEGVQAAKKPTKQEQRLIKMEQEFQFMKYVLNNIMKTLGDYPAVRAQVELLDYRTLGTIRATGACFSLMNNPQAPVQYEGFADMVEDNAKIVKEETFMELSNEDDKKRNLAGADADPIDEKSSVIFMTDCEKAPDQAIFRSKMEISSEDFKDHKDLFIGKSVGDKVTMNIRGNEHTATILSIRRPNADQQQQTTSQPN